MLRRLRRLSESECYARLYGQRDQDSVRLLDGRQRSSEAPVLSGEALRRLFEDRLDSREAEAA